MGLEGLGGEHIPVGGKLSAATSKANQEVKDAPAEFEQALDWAWLSYFVYFYRNHQMSRDARRAVEEADDAVSRGPGTDEMS